MIYSSFAQLPAFMQDYIRDIVGAHAAEWVAKPVPALKNRSFLQLINQEGVSVAAQYLTNVGTKFGVPYALEVPLDFAD